MPRNTQPRATVTRAPLARGAHKRKSRKQKEIGTMPETTTTATTGDAPAPATTEAPRLVKGSLVRDKGKLLLRLDCTGLHAYLDQLGVERDAQYKRFQNAPNTRYDVIDTGEHVLAPKALCSYLVGTDGRASGVLEYDLMRNYQTPPTLDAMKRIAESIPEAALAVVAHYQPVEISINVVGKKVIR